jgi:hypothetical protein
MYPHERSLVNQLSDKPFALVGVNSDGDLEAIREIVKEKNLTWRSFQNNSSTGTISDQWAIEGWPTIFILDEKGVIRFKGHGGDIDGTIEDLLGEMGHDVSIVMDDPGEAETSPEDDGTDGTRKVDGDDQPAATEKSIETKGEESGGDGDKE